MTKWLLHILLIGAQTAMPACCSGAVENGAVSPMGGYESASAGPLQCAHFACGDASEDPKTELVQAHEDVARLPAPCDSSTTAELAGTKEAAIGWLISLSDNTSAPLDESVEADSSGVVGLPPSIRVNTLREQFQISLFGGFSGEMIFATARPIIPSAVLQIFPDSGRDTQIAELHAKSSYLGMAIAGPSLGDLQSGGMVFANFYGENVLADEKGLFVAKAYGDLRSEAWRVAIGVDNDVVNPSGPTTINFTRSAGTGNVGFLRSQFRLEHYRHPSDDVQLTTQFALTDPVVTSFRRIEFAEGLVEDNGWPNVEGRLAIGLGTPQMRNAVAQRPLEAGVSGLVGQLRTAELLSNVVTDVWMIGADIRIPLTASCGFSGEFFHGKAIGIYNGAAAQTFTIATREPIRATGGWGEFFVDWTPCLHSHFGAGIDDPLDRNLSPFQIRRNEVVYANIIWDVRDWLDIGFEVSYRETAYVDLQVTPTDVLRDNQAMIYHTRVRMKF